MFLRLAFSALLLFTSACAYHTPGSESPRLDQVQFIGTHNSYHIEPDAALRVLWQTNEASREPSHQWLMYTHLPLQAQAELGIRFFEFDVHLDETGSAYSASEFLAPVVAAGLQPDSPFDQDGALSKPGTKVFHTNTDMRSTCLLLTDCLHQLNGWIDLNPFAGPILVQIEPKQLLKADSDPGRSWEILEQELLSAVPASRIFRPADLSAELQDLREAARAGRWPTVASIGDKFIFILNGSSYDTTSYTEALISKRAQLLFPAISDAVDPLAAFVSRNDPASHDIPGIVAAGQIVITYADWRTLAAREYDTRGRDAAFRSGAQLIATDYPIADRRLSDYSVRFSEGFVRNRPVISHEKTLTEAR